MLRILMKKNINILLKKSENNGLESLKDPNTFTEYSKSIQEYKYYYKKWKYWRVQPITGSLMY